nr:response regulator transcription factor [Alkalibacter mobilis]
MIYIAEDEDNIRDAVKAFLESEGYKVKDFSNGDLLYEEFLQSACDLVILDVMMPGSSGFEITKKIRASSTVPIIILTARDSEIDYATGINLGSDDYFTKPFSAMSLVMRVKAMLRRVMLDRQNVVETPDSDVVYGNMVIDKKGMVVSSEGKNIELTPTEYSLMVYLFDNSDRAVSRDELLDNIWGYGKDIETRACDDTVRRLRKKITHTTVRIETVWGFGFKLKEETP